MSAKRRTEEVAVFTRRASIFLEVTNASAGRDCPVTGTTVSYLFLKVR